MASSYKKTGVNQSEWSTPVMCLWSIQKRLLRSHGGDHASTVLSRLRFYLSELDQVGNHSFHDFPSFFDVGHFTAAEDNGNLHFIFVLEEASSLSNLRIDIVLTGFWSKTNFFGLRLMSVSAVVFLFVFLVLIFAEVHDSTNRRLFVWSHFDEVQSSIACSVKSFVRADDSQLSSVGTDDTDR